MLLNRSLSRSLLTLVCQIEIIYYTHTHTHTYTYTYTFTFTHTYAHTESVYHMYSDVGICVDYLSESKREMKIENMCVQGP